MVGVVDLLKREPAVLELGNQPSRPLGVLVDDAYRLGKLYLHRLLLIPDRIYGYLYNRHAGSASG